MIYGIITRSTMVFPVHFFEGAVRVLTHMM